MISAIASVRNRMTRSHLARRFISGASWSLVGSALSQLIVLLTMLGVARLLGKETYGQFVLMQTTINTFGVFAGFGIGATATRYIAALKSTETVRLGRILALSEMTVLIFGLFVSSALVFGSSLLAEGIFNTPDLASPLSIVAFAVLFATMDGYQKSALIGFESMRAYAVVTVVGAIAGLPIMLIAADAHGLDGVAYALVATTLVQAGISRFQVAAELRRAGISLNAKYCLREWQVLRDFALPALLAGALVTPAHWVCQAMLANTPNGYAQVAILGIAMQWFNAILFLPMVAGRVVMPMLTMSVAGNNHADSKSILVLAIKANAIVVLPMALIFAILSPWILSLYGPEFSNGSIVLAIAVLSAALVAITSPVGNLLAAHSRMWVGMAMNLAWAISYISLGTLLLKTGALGIVGAMGLAYLLHSLWVGWWTLHESRKWN